MYSDQETTQRQSCCGSTNINQKIDNNSQHSCCKLDAYDWLSDINLIKGKRVFDIVEVRFKNNRKDFYRSSEVNTLRVGDVVAVESSPGHDIGIVSLTGEIVRLQMIKKKVDYKTTYVKKVYRKARNTDIEKWTIASAAETPTMIQTRRIINESGLQMKINDVEYQGDKTKAVFYYTAEGRVDFRELIKILAEKFSVRIEMKQIGVRQESSRLGGIGSCGRELCCSSWLTNFRSVSTSSARTQQLSMNPQKLAGQCGKLKCCLNFEYDNYKEEIEKFPNSNSLLQTKAGEAFFQKMDVLSGMMFYSYKSNPSQFIPIKREDVAIIHKLNKQGKLPDTLDEYTEFVEEKVRFDNVIGQDDLTRFDNLDKINNRKQRNKNQGPNGARDQKTSKPAQSGNPDSANNEPRERRFDKTNNQTSTPKEGEKPRQERQDRPERTPQSDNRRNNQVNQAHNNQTDAQKSNRPTQANRPNRPNNHSQSLDIQRDNQNPQNQHKKPEGQNPNHNPRTNQGVNQTRRNNHKPNRNHNTNNQSTPTDPTNQPKQ
jgi:cell fate regulator YaaT (PSP1 superfamily)